MFGKLTKKGVHRMTPFESALYEGESFGIIQWTPLFNKLSPSVSQNDVLSRGSETTRLL